MSATVSIVVPVYNAQEHLEETVSSLLAQTYRELEIILVNDGSTDKSPEICKSFAEKDSRVKVIDRQNGGLIAARRTGIENFSGDYVMFSDADDWLPEDAAETLVNAIEKEAADIAVARLKFVKSLKTEKLNTLDNLDSYLKQQPVYQGDELRQKLLRSFLYSGSLPVSLCGKLYKKALFHDVYKYAEGIAFFGEDRYTNMALFANADKVVLVDKVTYFYRAGGGTSKYMSGFFSDIVWGYKNDLKLIDDFDFDREESIKRVSEYFLALIETVVNNLLLDKTKSRREYIDKITEYVNDPAVRLACERADCDRLRTVERMILAKDADGIFLYASKTMKRSKYRQMIKNILARFGVRC
ncbi:MAG: glycosyltransferase [Clostridiales bacterium]|nr:glycosyltransferase [Clostridiales bacterium]